MRIASAVTLRGILAPLLAVAIVLAGAGAALGTAENVEIDAVPDNHSNSGGANDTSPGSANAETCDANLGDFTDTNGDDAWDTGATVSTGRVHAVCVSAEDDTGAELEAQMVTLTSTGTGSLTDSLGGTPTTTSSSPITSGYALFYAFSSTAGSQFLSASISGIADTDAATITWATPPPACPGFEGSKVNQVVGTTGNDVLTGGRGKDVICGLEGDDVLSGLSGKDTVLGGSGNDMLNGGNGKDKLFGEADNDTLNGGNGKDGLDGGSEVDSCSGGRGKDAETGCE
ncbi:MAG: calcium-binding protein [Actinomycetota bacterium]